MKLVQFPIKLLALIGLIAVPQAHSAPTGGHLLDHELRRLNSDERVNLKEAYAGKVVLVVNTASKCGFTGQYEGLEALYARYGERGLVVLGFPSNDFAGQEPGTEAQIQDFCRLTYSVRFPMFEKVSVRKGSAHPLYQGLAEAAGRYPKWNFHKYLVDREGRLVDDFLTITSPQSGRMVEAIERLL